MAWVVTTGAGFALVAWADPDPLTLRGAILPLPALGVLSALLIVLAWRFGDVSGAACGVFAGWVALVLRTMLNGTPYGFAGLYGDMGRIAASATRYTVTPWSADAFVEEVPAEYPMLYPWLIGRASVLTGVPAWRLVPEAEILVTSGAVVAAYLLWARLVRPPVALGIAAAGLSAFGDPRKAFCVIAALVVTPWAILAFGASPRGRPAWWAAGLVGGVMVMTYQGFLIYAAPGLLALLALTWWRAPDRWAYMIHVALVVTCAAAVSAVYVVPYVLGALKGGQPLADLYVSPDMAANPFPFLDPTPLGLLQLAGMAGLILLRGREWWAAPMLLLLAGLYVYRVAMMARFVLDGHSGFYHYTTRMAGPLLAAAGVLTLATLLARARPGRYGAAALAVLLTGTGAVYWRTALPEDVQPWASAWPSGRHFFTGLAHRETGFPARLIRDRVAAVLGPAARPRVLSADERLFSYLPWKGYIGGDRTAANTLTRYDDRRAELARLAAIRDPAEFARASATTRFGAIDVFVLDAWRWRGITFQPAQFAGFRQFTELPERLVLLVRT
ncbi:arabinofuranosyltransferase [Nonomuraea typhae]|uniref:arabinofuranosyltransferase n=1 Tax=Nonomuraea typhae TaxID=2603600 RepID=UPI0012FAE23D|nr:arabinofuranosyltransferase [Nonomuraea typhae]